MRRIIVLFMKKWIDAQRKRGVRVIRQLEKEIAQMDGFSLVASGSDSLSVEVDFGTNERFVQWLAEHLTTEFGEAEPWAHTCFEGQIEGLDVPTKWKEDPAASKVTDFTSVSPAQPQPRPQVQTAPAQTKVVKASANMQEEATEDPAKVLADICARPPVKYSPELQAHLREANAVIPSLKQLGTPGTLWHQHLLMAMDEGYGRTEFLTSLVRLYQAHMLMRGDVNPSQAVCECILLSDAMADEADDYHLTWKRLLSFVKSMVMQNTQKGISRAVLYLDITAWQSSLETPEAKGYLRRLNSLCGTFHIVFRVPFAAEKDLQKTADALNDILNVRTIAVPPPPLDDLLEYASGKLRANHFRLAENARASLRQLVLWEKQDDSFFGYKTIDKVVQKVIYEKGLALATCQKAAESRTITADDLKPLVPVEVGGTTGSGLEDLIGMKFVAQRVEEIIAQIKEQKRLVEKGKRVERPAIHMLFTGNPGTGKTTVARVVAQKMRQAGILRKGGFVEVKARDLCGEYVGHTAPRVSKICQSAYGSVLFIDEAYSLFRNGYDENDYGREALDTLVAEMENHRDDLCVIMAGYKDEMETMLKGNAGLKSRIPYEIEFPNYNRDDLEKIFLKMLLDEEIDYEEGLKDTVREFLDNLPDAFLVSKEFGNARLVRNLYERAWAKAAFRTSKNGGDLRILRSDLAAATEDSEFRKLREKKTTHRKIGFAV